MPILEPGTYRYVDISDLVVSPDGDMVLQLRVRTGNDQITIQHHLGKVPPTTEESVYNLCAKYLYMKFPPQLVEEFLDYARDFHVDLVKYVVTSSHSSHDLSDQLHTSSLSERFKQWALEAGLWKQ